MKKMLSFLYRLLVIVSLVNGITLNLLRVNSITKIMAYFTLQINVISLAVYLVFEILDVFKVNYQKYNFYYLIKGELIVSVILMMLVYLFALAPNHFRMTYTENIIADMFVHIISPALIIIDYILFENKGNFKKAYPITWTFLPTAYGVFVYLFSFFGGKFYSIGGSRKYGYSFLDIEKNGILRVVLNVLSIIAIVILLGILLVYVDKKLSKKKKDL